MEAINKSTEPITAAALLQKPEDGYRYELVQGELVRMSPTGGRHGIIAMGLGRLLGNWADEYQIGVVCAAETGFKLKSDPDTVRAADVSLVRHSRITAQGAPETFWEGAPDLAVEVLSPSDRMGDVLEKVRDYLDAGTDQVWIVDPQSATLSVYRSLKQVQILSQQDELAGEGIAAGFRCNVGTIFS